MKRVLHISSLPSPFMVEFADAWRELAGWSVHQAFWQPSAAHRGAHWDIKDSEHITIRQAEAPMGRWIEQLFADQEPGIVILGTVTGEPFAHAARLARDRQIRIGCWLEQPFPPGVSFGPAERLQDLKRATAVAGAPYTALKQMVYRRALARSRPDFVLAIGDRAYDFYQAVTASNCWVADFPYVQDLEFALAFDKPKAPGITRFVFSGQMVPRNNWTAIASAFGQLATTHPDQFRLRVAASGERDNGTAVLHALAGDSPRLLEHIAFDADFTSWNDRLVPLGESDVLVVPSHHHGWGLVVPEGLASGCAIISSRGVESARRLVRPMINGLICDGTTAKIYDCLRFCIEHPRWRQTAQYAARASVEEVSAKAGAERAATLFSVLED